MKTGAIRRPRVGEGRARHPPLCCNDGSNFKEKSFKRWQGFNSTSIFFFLASILSLARWRYPRTMVWAGDRQARHPGRDAQATNIYRAQGC